MHADVLVFGAHPDDAEIGMGGTIAKMTDAGLSVALIDATEGEMGTRGSVEIRQKESFRSAIILKTAHRINLHLPDGHITESKDAVAKIVGTIRHFKPKIIFAPYFNDRHPDHYHLSHLVKEAFFFTGAAKFTSQYEGVKKEAYRPAKLFYYMQTYPFEPTQIVDISAHWETKMKSVRAYESQFYNPHSKEPETFIAKPDFLNYLESRSRFYGFQIGVQFAEPFYCEEKIGFDITGFVKH